MSKELSVREYNKVNFEILQTICKVTAELGDPAFINAVLARARAELPLSLDEHAWGNAAGSLALICKSTPIEKFHPAGS